VFWRKNFNELSPVNLVWTRVGPNSYLELRKVKKDRKGKTKVPKEGQPSVIMTSGSQIEPLN